MIKFLLTLFLVFVLSGCSIDWNWEKDEKIVELEKQLNDDIFEKNKECLSYKNDILSEIERSNLIKVNYRIIENLEDIFYSPLKNTCIYTTYNTSSSCSWYIIYNYFSVKQFLEDVVYEDNSICNYMKTNQLYIDRIKELKWE